MMPPTTRVPGKYYKRSNFNLNTILPAYLTILIVCIVGNFLIIITIIKNRNMRTRCYCFLANLSMADLGFALSTPVHILQFVKFDIGKFTDA